MGKDADLIISLYRRHALAWSGLRSQDLFEKPWLDRFISQLPAQRSVLDLGCGSGAPIGRYLAMNGCDITGVDTSEELLVLAAQNLPDATFVLSDMRGLAVSRVFSGILAWDSMFHLAQADQRAMFPIFQAHAGECTALMFTSGPSNGEAIGELQGERLYHASLDADEYRDLLFQHGFDVLEHVVEDPECGGHTIWLAKYRSTA